MCSNQRELNLPTTSCPQLEHLELRFYLWMTRGLPKRALTSLRVNFYLNTSIDLTEMVLFECRNPSSDLQQDIINAPKLEHVYAVSPYISEDVFWTLATKPGLKTLSLPFPKFGSQLLTLPFNLPPCELTRLDLTGWELGPGVLDWFMNKLEVLHLGNHPWKLDGGFFHERFSKLKQVRFLINDGGVRVRNTIVSSQYKSIEYPKSLCRSTNNKKST